MLCLAKRGHTVGKRSRVFCVSAKAVSVQRRGAVLSGCLPSSLSHCRHEGEPGAVICVAIHVKINIPYGNHRHTLPYHCLMSLSPTPVLLCSRKGRRVTLLNAELCALGSAFCMRPVGFGEPAEHGKVLLGAGHRVDTRGGSSMEEKME